MNPFIGCIILFAGNFAPRSWALCNGQLLSIAQNTALFSILGTTFGGNGQTTFGLPDLRGRVPVHPGQGPGLSNYVLGEMSGAETNTLLLNNLPPHNHPLNALTNAGNTSVPTGAYLGNTGALDKEYNANTAGTATVVAMHPGAIGATGGSAAFNIIQPYLAINFIIALQGIFPSRN